MGKEQQQHSRAMVNRSVSRIRAPLAVTEEEELTEDSGSKPSPLETLLPTDFVKSNYKQKQNGSVPAAGCVNRVDFTT